MTTFLVLTENNPGVLYKIADVFLKQKINIQSLTVAEVDENISRFTITTASLENELREKINKQLYRIIEVIKVIDAYDNQLIFKEIVLIKIKITSPIVREQIDNLVYLYQGKIIYVAKNTLYLEKEGSEEEINSFLSSMRFYGVQEIVRSGRVALLKPEVLKEKIDFSFNYPLHLEFLDISMIKKIELYAKKFQGVISLAQGTPSSPTPDFIKEAAKKAIDFGLSDRYTPGYGIDELKEAIVEKLKRDNQIRNIDKENILVTHGATEALMATFLSLFNQDDEIILISPTYATYINQIRLIKRSGRVVFVKLEAKNNQWFLDFKKLESTITINTRAIIICNPSNPLGKVYSKDELMKILEIAKKYNLFIITDEIYEYFNYDSDSHISFASLPGAFERTISIFGVSKSYSMTGWRIGYLVAEKEIINQIYKVHDSLITCPTAVSQYAALAAIKSGKTIPLKLKEEYQRKIDLVVKILSSCPKVSFIRPKGAYYLFFKVLEVKDDYWLAMKLIEEAKVAFVPGSAFGLGGEGYLRAALCREENDIKEGFERLVHYLNKVKF